MVYTIHLTHSKTEDAHTIELHNPADMPDPNRIESIEEPWIEATIYVPDEYLGSILKLCQDRRGIQKNLTYVGGRAQLVYELPLNEVVFDFYDRLKSISRGYASFDYHQIGYREGDLVKMGILVNNEPVDALSMIVHRGTAEARGRGMCERLKDLIPRHLFKIPIQAAIGGKVIARETIAAMRKDVTAKCYGGDISRKRKLLDKQKEGKKRMREYGIVQHPAGGVHRGAAHGRRRLRLRRGSRSNPELDEDQRRAGRRPAELVLGRLVRRRGFAAASGSAVRLRSLSARIPHPHDAFGARRDAVVPLVLMVPLVVMALIFEMPHLGLQIGDLRAGGLGLRRGRLRRTAGCVRAALRPSARRRPRHRRCSVPFAHRLRRPVRAAWLDPRSPARASPIRSWRSHRASGSSPQDPPGTFCLLI